MTPAGIRAPKFDVVYRHCPWTSASETARLMSRLGALVALHTDRIASVHILNDAPRDADRKYANRPEPLNAEHPARLSFIRRAALPLRFDVPAEQREERLRAAVAAVESQAQERAKDVEFCLAQGFAPPIEIGVLDPDVDVSQALLAASDTEVEAERVDRAVRRNRLVARVRALERRIEALASPPTKRRRGVSE